MAICCLPSELLDEIFKHFDGVTLARSRQVCRLWRDLHEQSKYNLLWRRACYVELPREDGLSELLGKYVSDGAFGEFYDPEKLKRTCNDRCLLEIPWLNVYREWFRCRHVGRWPCMLQEFLGHEGAVYDARFSGDRVVSCGEDNTIRVWDGLTKECEHIFTGHLGPVLCIALRQRQGWLSTGKHPHDVIVSGSSDCSIKVWHLSDRRCLCTLRGHNSGVTCVAVEGDIVLSGSLDNSTRIWDISKTTCLHVLRHMDFVKYVAFWEEQFITVLDSGQVTFWSLNTMDQLLSVQVVTDEETRNSGVNGAVVRGRKGLLTTGNCKLFSWQRTDECAPMQGFPGIGSSTSAAQVGTCMAMHCNLVAIGTRYGAVYFYHGREDWRKQFYNVHAVVRSGTSNINSVALGDDGEGPSLVTAGHDGIVRVHRWFGPSTVHTS